MGVRWSREGEAKYLQEKCQKMKISSKVLEVVKCQIKKFGMPVDRFVNPSVNKVTKGPSVNAVNLSVYITLQVGSE